MAEFFIKLVVAALLLILVAAIALPHIPLALSLLGLFVGALLAILHPRTAAPMLALGLSAGILLGLENGPEVILFGSRVAVAGDAAPAAQSMANWILLTFCLGWPLILGGSLLARDIGYRLVLRSCLRKRKWIAPVLRMSVAAPLTLLVPLKLWHAAVPLPLPWAGAALLAILLLGIRAYLASSVRKTVENTHRYDPWLVKRSWLLILIDHWIAARDRREADDIEREIFKILKSYAFFVEMRGPVSENFHRARLIEAWRNLAGSDSYILRPRLEKELKAQGFRRRVVRGKVVDDWIWPTA
ncbi:hypothetical protein NHN26_15930 [Rhodovulum tesquicola]|uniref:hypothetical protein n=1 Tax=Rhodovulum tesquicola TaxID=540254 RepID=UPI00209813B8|nr:hypothetical protein [Rhodovulum tesquicola]MCO8146702.1 hypothetical protein [Rhodovulum tesquicola]